MDNQNRGRDERPVVRYGGEALPGQRIGDRRIRVTRPKQQLIEARAEVRRLTAWHPARTFIFGFAGLILIGTVILMLPFSSADGTWTPVVDALFTATSAVCVTGLVVLDTGTYWSGFGQAVIMVLIQLGGFGFMTSATLLLLLVGQSVTLRQRVLLREALAGGALGTLTGVVRRVFIFTIAMELIGTVVLTLRFMEETDFPQALWLGLFHAISAFNNAGFDLMGDFQSIQVYSADPLMVGTFTVLVILGAISYPVVEDVIRRRRFALLSLNTKIVLAGSVALFVGGTLVLLLAERGNHATIGGMDYGLRMLNAFFLAASSRTAGFSTIDIGAMTEPGLLALIVLMFIGGAAASTAGGIKLQTFFLLFFAILSAVRGMAEVQAFRRRVPLPDVLRALTIALLGIAIIFSVSFGLDVLEDFSFIQLLFEATSAAGIVGLSTGITPDLSPASRLLVIVTMFMGRLGPLTLVLALSAREFRRRYTWPQESIKIG